MRFMIPFDLNFCRIEDCSNHEVLVRLALESTKNEIFTQQY